MRRIAVVISVSLLSAVCGCNEPVVNSAWADKPVSLDGLAKDWSPNGKDECGGFAFAAKNDSDNLYLYIAPKSAKAKQYLASAGAQNFTIWLDLDLRSEKGLGLRILSEGARKGARGERPGNGSGERPAFGQDGPEEAEGAGASVKALNSGPEVRETPVKLLGFGDAPGSVGGAAVKLGNVYVRGVLEAKIPLSMLGDEPPSRLMVGISADLPASYGKPGGKRQMSGSGNEMSSGRPSGGRGPGGGGGPGGGIGGPGGGMGGPSMPGSSMGGGAAGSSSSEVAEEPLEIWATVILAAPPRAPGV